MAKEAVVKVRIEFEPEGIIAGTIVKCKKLCVCTDLFMRHYEHLLNLRLRGIMLFPSAGQLPRHTLPRGHHG